ncbi:MAG: tetratricopeptide repeat protein, partial [Planctomycetota bacterium]
MTSPPSIVHQVRGPHRSCLQRSWPRLACFEMLGVLILLLAGCGGQSEENTSVVSEQPENSKREQATPKTAQNVSNAEDLTTEGGTKSQSQISEVDEPLADRRVSPVGDSAPTSENDLERQLMANPSDPQAAFQLAVQYASTGNREEAVELLAAVDFSATPMQVPSLGLRAQCCFELGRFREAEFAYLDLLKIEPRAVPAIRQLGFLYNRQGRRHEAAVRVRQLCFLGDVRQEELHSLIDLSSSIFDDPEDTKEEQSNQAYRVDGAYFPIGGGGWAREYYTRMQYQKAIDALDPVLDEADTPTAWKVLLGRVLAEAGEFELYLDWLAKSEPKWRTHADFWGALGAYLVQQGRYDEALGPLIEALARDGSDLRSLTRLSQVFRVTKQLDALQKAEERLESTRSVLVANQKAVKGKAKADLLLTLAEKLDVVQRSIESGYWRAIAANQLKDQQLRAQSQDRLRGLMKNGGGFASIDYSTLGLRDSKAGEVAEKLIASLIESRDMQSGNDSNVATEVHPAKDAKPVFADLAAEMGIEHTYHSADEEQLDGFTIYQQIGGGVAVTDIDL